MAKKVCPQTMKFEVYGKVSEFNQAEIQALLNTVFAYGCDSLASSVLDGAKEELLNGTATLDDLRKDESLKAAFKIEGMDAAAQEKWFKDLEAIMD